MQMKKVLVSLLILTMALAGCGSAGGSSGKSDGGNAKAPEGTVAAKGSKYAEGLYLPKLENKKVTWLVSTTAETIKGYNTEKSPNESYHAMETWKATYGEEIELKVSPWDDFTSYLSTMAASGNTPDVVYGGTVWFPNWPAKGLVQPLEKYDEYLKLSDDIWRNEITDQFKWDGKQYVVYGKNPEWFYICYNKTKFEQAGETTPLEHWKNGKWNWTQFVNTAKNMTDAANNEYGYAGWNLGFNKCIYPIISVDGNKIVNNVTSQKIVRWFTEINAFHKTGAVRTDNENANFLKRFPAGHDAMISISPEEYIRMRVQLDVTGGDEFELAPFPVFDPNGETQPLTTANIYGHSISANAANPEGAAAFIRLYYDITNNISDSFGDLGLFGTYLSDDEKAAIKEANKAPLTVNYVAGMGNAVKLFNDTARGTIYSATKEGSVASLLDSYKPLLDAEIKNFEGSIS